MAKKKSVNMSVFAYWIDVLSNLKTAIKKLGGTEEVFSRFNDQNIIDEVAKILVGKAKKVLKTLTEFIAPLKLDYVNSDITEANFPPQPQDNDDSEKEYKVFNFGSTSSEKAIAGMAKEGFRPATTREQLQWAVKNWNGKDWVVALGQTWLGSRSGRLVSVLNFRGGGRQLALVWFGDGWNDVCQFLAVRK